MLVPIVLVVSLLALLSVALLRALATPKAAAPCGPPPDAELAAAAGVEDGLAALVRRATVSSYEPELEDEEAFAGLIADVERLFPGVHSVLEREQLGGRAMLFGWPGQDPTREPAILCSHFDVVPAMDAPAWRHAPFSGDIADGYVWGRGSQDVKLTLVSVLHAAERLLAEGFRPLRSIYFAFGGDEETGGARGARRIAKALAAKGVRASFLLDEGGPVAEGMLAFADRPLALIGIAEKGYLDAALVASGEGGHASMPPRRTVAGNLARAVAAIEHLPPPARLCFTVRSFLSRVAPYCSFPYRLVFRNLWLTAPLVKAIFCAEASTNALVRTTAAPTMLEGSPKENVLAERARAIINVRALPGDSSTAVLARLGRIVAPLGAVISAAHPDAVVEPLPESPLDHEGYRAVEAAVAAAFPEASCVPFLFSAATDTKHYRDVAEAIYRFTPARQTRADLAGIHGRDERVRIDDVRRCELFYAALLRGL